MKFKNRPLLYATLAILAAIPLTLFAAGKTPFVGFKGVDYYIGQDSSFKLGFYGKKPIAQPVNTIGTRAVLESLGLVAPATSGGPTSPDELSKTADDTIGDGVDWAFGTTTGSKLGTAVGQKLAFHNSTPVVQRVGSAQAAVNATPVASVGATYDQTEVNAIVTKCNANMVLVNELRAALVEKGLIKGAP